MWNKLAGPYWQTGVNASPNGESEPYENTCNTHMIIKSAAGVKLSS